MTRKMMLKDISDMEIYLEERCYCPGEIYDMSGFFFKVYQPTDECTLLAEGKYSDTDVKLVLCENQLIAIFIERDKVRDCERYDATENNMRELTKAIREGSGKVHIDEFVKGKTEADLKKIMSIADAVMI